MDTSERILPPHIEETVHAIANLQAAHNERASALQRAINRATAFIGQPRFIVQTAAAGFGWMCLNLGLKLAGWEPPDPPPFAWMLGALTAAAFFVALIILATQRYSDQLAGYREQLTLELAILTEQKTSKLIELLEEQRRDNPLVRDSHDAEAAAFAESANPETVLEAIKDAHEEAENAGTNAT